MNEDKYGCDECFKVAELYCCERCDALLCSECFDAHDKREHLYPINRWRSVPSSVSRLEGSPR
jgi:hypothetical protein